MAKIIENPQTKQLYLEGCGGVVFTFDGTPLGGINTDAWKVVSEAECLIDWFEQPGKYKTLYGTFDVLMSTPDGDKFKFTMGETILYLRNWVKDAEEAGNEVYTINEAAYTDRNVARSFATC